jgi:uncharacterized protein (UPF0333 family)
MKQRKISLTILAIVFSLTLLSAQKISNSIQTDFIALTGSWKGSLTYLDYTSGKPYTMPADIDIKQVDKSNKFIFSNIYPNEQSANSTDTISIAADGRYIDKERVISKKKDSNGDIEIVTEEKGTDGNDHKKATIRHTYLIGKNHFSKRKDVKFDGEVNWIKRHEYSYTRKAGR